RADLARACPTHHGARALRTGLVDRLREELVDLELQQTVDRENQGAARHRGRARAHATRNRATLRAFLDDELAVLAAEDGVVLLFQAALADVVDVGRTKHRRADERPTRLYARRLVDGEQSGDTQAQRLGCLGLGDLPRDVREMFLAIASREEPLLELARRQ